MTLSLFHLLINFLVALIYDESKKKAKSPLKLNDFWRIINVPEVT